jgi:troponin I, cardiac muscle
MSDEHQEQVIVQKTAEELKKQQEREAEERARTVASRVPQLSIDGLDQGGLEKKVREFYDLVVRLEDEKYDWEFKLRKMDFEINELNIIVNDIKGHFVKPALKKISKTEQKLAKIAEVKSKLGSAFRENLKSTGQSKFALDDKDDGGKKPEWGQDQLKQHKEEEGLAGEEAAQDEEEEEEEEEEE